ncbi:unnamed protein product [Boreogadus saida]
MLVDSSCYSCERKTRVRWPPAKLKATSVQLDHGTHLVLWSQHAPKWPNNREAAHQVTTVHLLQRNSQWTARSQSPPLLHELIHAAHGSSRNHTALSQYPVAFYSPLSSPLPGLRFGQ